MNKIQKILFLGSWRGTVYSCWFGYYKNPDNNIKYLVRFLDNVVIKNKLGNGRDWKERIESSF